MELRGTVDGIAGPLGYLRLVIFECEGKFVDAFYVVFDTEVDGGVVVWDEFELFHGGFDTFGEGFGW